MLSMLEILHKNWTLSLLVLGVFCLPFSVTLDNFILVSSAVSVCWFFFQPIPVPLRLKYCYGLLAALFFWMVLSSFVFNQPEAQAWKQLSRYAREGLIFIGVSLLCLQSKKDILDLLCKTLLLGCVPGVVFSLVCFIHPAWLFQGVPFLGSWVYFLYDTTMVGPLPYGIMVVFSLFYSFTKWFEGASRSYLYAGILLSSYVVVGTSQRLTMLLWLLSLIYMPYILLPRDSKRQKIMYAGLIVGCGFGFILYLSPHFYGRFIELFYRILTPETTAVSESISTRLMLQYIAFKMVCNSWVFGFGLGSFNPYIQNFYPNTFNVGNFYLQAPESSYAHIAAELGLVGLLLFILWLVAVFCCIRSSPGVNKSLGSWLFYICILTTGVISSFIDHSSFMFFMVFLGCAVGMSQSDKTESV
jgi:hypothetical protein